MQPETNYLEQIRDLLRSSLSSLSSVQLEHNSRGTNVTVKAYSINLSEAARLAEQEYDRLNGKYNTAAE